MIDIFVNIFSFFKEKKVSAYLSSFDWRFCQYYLLYQYHFQESCFFNIIKVKTNMIDVSVNIIFFQQTKFDLTFHNLIDIFVNIVYFINFIFKNIVFQNMKVKTNMIDVSVNSLFFLWAKESMILSFIIWLTFLSILSILSISFSRILFFKIIKVKTNMT